MSDRKRSADARGVKEGQIFRHACQGDAPRDEGVKIDVLYARDDIYGERESIVSPYPRRCPRRRGASAESDPEVLSRVP